MILKYVIMENKDKSMNFTFEILSDSELSCAYTGGVAVAEATVVQGCVPVMPNRRMWSSGVSFLK